MIRIIDHEGNGYGAQAEITRKKGVNGEKSLSGVIYTNDQVLHGVDRGWKLEFENEMYAFTFALPNDTGNRIELDFDAVHEFFYDMSKSAQNDLLSDGSHTFETYLKFIFDDTPYNYSLDVDVSAFEKETFGQRNRLDLFYDVIDTAGVEFSVNGSVIRIIERVGNDLSTIVKKGFNLNELRLEKNIGDFVTYQKGFGAWYDEEDHSKGRLEVEYLSPLAETYGKLDADPVVDERYAVKNNLLTRLQNNVEGSYQISVQIDMEDLTRAGYEYKQPHEGDSIMAINDDLGFQRKVRIVSYETDFDIEGNMLDHRITCNSLGVVEQSISSENNIRHAINELQNDMELQRQQITEARLSADGKGMNYYGPVEPSEEDYKLNIGDTWFDTSSETIVVKAWNGVEWRNTGLDSEALDRKFDEIDKDIEETKENIDNRLSDLNTDIADKFTSLDEEILSIEAISNSAQSNASDALDGVENALSSANTALSNSNDAMANAQTAIGNASDAQARADDALVNAQNALDGFNGLEIGGRNYILNSKEILADASQSPNLFLKIQLTESIKPGEEFIFQTYYDFLEGSSDVIRVATRFDDGTSWAVDEISVDSSGQILVKRTNTSNRKLGRVFLYAGGYGDTKGNIVKFTKLSLTKGNKATDWSPAPEDAEQKIASINYELDEINGQLSLTATQSALDALEGVVTDQELEITANAEALALKADKSTVDTINRTVEDHSLEIEANAEGIKLKADSEKVDNLEDKVTNQGLDITANANELTLKANQSVVDSLKGTVDDHALEISANAKGLDLKADSQTVNAIEGTVSNLSTEVGVIAGELNAKADSSLVDTISGIVDNHTLDIRANAEGLTFKADSSRVDTLEGAVSSLGAEFDVVAGKVSSKVWMSDIDDIEIGGRNLYSTNSNARARENTDDFMGSPYRFYIHHSWFQTANRMIVEPSTEYVISMWAKTKSGSPEQINLHPVQYTTRSGSTRSSSPSSQFRMGKEWTRVVYYLTTHEDSESMELYMVSEPRTSGNEIWVSGVQVEKGTKATDWSPAPEDTDAKFEYIESEFTQTFESFEQEVSSIDGRVTSQEQRVDSITTTIQEVTESVNGNTTLINQTKSTVDSHTQTIATIETDLEGKSTVAQYNTLVSTVEGSIQRIGNAEGDITQIEANISGLQTTVAGKASQTEVTQLSNLYSVVVSDLTDLETDTEAQFSVMSEQINLRVTSNQLDTAISDSLSTAEAYADATAQTAQEAAQEYAETKAEAERELAEIYAGGLVSSEQEERIAAIKNNLSEAQKYAETKADEAKTAADNYTDTVADEKVDIGQVVSQINIETDNILIESGKLLLDAETVAFSGSAFIPGAYIENASIDNAKIADATISSAKIAKLDVNKLSGNRTEFVESYWNSAVGGNVRITGSGILTTASDGSQVLIQNGVMIARNPGGNSLGQIGYRYIGGSPYYNIHTTLGAHFSVSARDWDGRDKPMMEVSPDKGGTIIYQRLRVMGGINFNFAHYISPASNRLAITGRESVSLRARESTIFAVSRSSNGSNSASLWANLNMEGSRVTNQSDRRLKTNVIPTQTNSLKSIKSMVFVEFDRTNNGHHDDIGVIAQDTPSLSIYDSESDTWMIDNSKQLMMNSHGIQQLAIQHENTLELASAAYIGIEEHQETLDNHDSRIESLEKELEEANQKIEELERKVA